ncbi:hypothetical protein [Paenibacillus sp. DMB20]|uniref:hypothetical protein n=1 Tax=Paenibacillus sp. DMB20 TaxID=1642570 RepID=UPI000ACF2ADC|nr:hypothetical protein [Paenibacillus sp. DMB20]
MDDTNVLMEQYVSIKDIAKRNAILKQLIFNLPTDGKDFFLKAFKKERYLDMKLTAVRGYAAYADQNEVAVLMKKMLELLKKRPESTPYNYQEYEILRSSFLMQYLLRQYNYECFKTFNDQLEQQYNAMPEAFKGIFTCDENGEAVQLISPKESQKRIDDFFSRNK